MNTTSINISDLPDDIRDCYLKWKEITDIDDLDSFFQDILLTVPFYNQHKYIFTSLNDDYIRIHCENRINYAICIRTVDKKTLISSGFRDFIKGVNELYERIK